MLVEVGKANEMICQEMSTAGLMVYCKGPVCMAWEYADSILDKLQTDDNKSRGYCGKIGKPLHQY